MVKAAVLGSQPITVRVVFITGNCYIEGVWFYCIFVQVYDRSKLYYSCRFMHDNMALMVATLQDLLIIIIILKSLP